MRGFVRWTVLSALFLLGVFLLRRYYSATHVAVALWMLGLCLCFGTAMVALIVFAVSDKSHVEALGWRKGPQEFTRKR